MSSLNDVLSCLLRNPVVPQMPEHIVETVNAIPQKWISEFTVDIPVAPTEYVTPLLLVEFTTQAPSVTHFTPSEQLSPLSQETFESLQIGFVHPPDSVTLVELFSSHVVGVLLLSDEFAASVHQEQIASGQTVHLPIPHIQEIPKVSDSKDPQSERIEEQIVDTLDLPTMDETLQRVLLCHRPWKNSSLP